MRADAEGEFTAGGGRLVGRVALDAGAQADTGSAGGRLDAAADVALDAEGGASAPGGRLSGGGGLTLDAEGTVAASVPTFEGWATMELPTDADEPDEPTDDRALAAFALRRAAMRERVLAMQGGAFEDEDDFLVSLVLARAL